MKILAISDYESPALWDYFRPEKLDGIDLILSCGDLDPHYLSFLATFAHCPVLYVHGNHDGRYEQTPPLGCTSIDGQVYVHEGVRIAGLGGSMRYKPGPHQYTERQMTLRAWTLAPRILAKGGIDILMTHAPGAGMVPGEDSLAHRGFAVFNRMIDRYRPALFLHGHTHLPYTRLPRESRRGDTRVVNAYERCILEL